MKIWLYGINDYIKLDHGHYADAYIETYLILIKEVENLKYKKNLEFYPILYIYAHILELTCKNILNVFHIICPLIKIKKIHDLKSLWNTEVKHILSHLPNRFNYKDIEKLQELIYEMSEIEKFQQVFRYPDSLQKDTVDITNLLKSYEDVLHIRKINNHFISISYLIQDMEIFEFTLTDLKCFEEIAKDSNVIEQKDLRDRFKDKYFHALLILKKHYVDLNFGQSCQLDPRIINISKIKEIINISHEMQTIRNNIHKEFAHNAGEGISFEEITKCIRDEKLTNLTHVLEVKFSSFSDEELIDLESLMDLARNCFDIWDYLLITKSLTSKFHRDEIIRRLLSKAPLGDYLQKSLKILGH